MYVAVCFHAREIATEFMHGRIYTHAYKNGMLKLYRKLDISVVNNQKKNSCRTRLQKFLLQLIYLKLFQLDTALNRMFLQKFLYFCRK